MTTLKGKITQIVTITAPSCSGKSSTEGVLAAYFGFGRVVSCTTRQPRPGEIDGIHYYFLSVEDFANQDFIEQLEYDGNRYGIRSAELDRLVDAGFNRVVIVAEPKGVVQIQQWSKQHDISCLSVFLSVNRKLCYNRLLLRYDCAEAHNKLDLYSNRLSTMYDEMRWIDLDIPWQVVHIADMYDKRHVASIVCDIADAQLSTIN